MNISLQNGQYLDSEGRRQPFTQITISDGVIKAIDENSANADQVIDCSGRVLIPTLTDLGQILTQIGPAALENELRAAAAGGVGRVCMMPSSSPVNDTPAIAKLIEKNSREAKGAQLMQMAAMTKNLEGKQLTEYAELTDAGCIALSNAFEPLESLAITKRCFDYAHTFNAPVFLHPMEPSLYKGSMHNGAMSTFMGLKGIPEIAETVAIAQLLTLAEASGVHLHLSQVSCADSVELIREAKSRGLRVTADVAVANLCFTDKAVEGFNSLFHVRPPLRSEIDRKALIEGIKDKTLDAISSGHRPCDAASKNAPFAESALGMSTVEYLIPLAIDLESREELSLAQFVSAMNEGASSVLGIHPAALKVGEKANFFICDIDGCNSASIRDRHSEGQNTPHPNGKVPRIIEHTFVNGMLVFSA